jgi:ankyrin repeat protein
LFVVRYIILLQRSANEYLTEEFNAQVKHCGLGSVRIPAEPRRPWRRINDRLLAVILEQKVILPQESNSQLINKLRGTANALASARTEGGESSHETQDNALEILCTVAVLNLAQWRIWEVSSYDEDVMMLSPAAAAGNIVLMKELLKGGADVNVSDSIFGSPLNAAAIGGHEAAARLLIEKGANIEFRQSTESGTAICQAARYGRDSVVRLLLEKGAKISFDPLERQALHHAMTNGGHEAVAIALIGGGAQVNAKTGRGETALHFAASIGVREAVIRLLLKRGADIEAKNNKGWTPLFIAATRKREDMVKYLLARGANIQATDNSDKTILHHLVKLKAQISLIQRFVNCGINLDAKDESGETALLLAVNARQKDVITLLLENRADIQVTTNNGVTPLHNAVDQFNVSQSIVTLLLKSGADVTARTMDGKEALHMSAARGHEAILRLLLDAGANPNAVAKDGTTALQSASLRGNDNMVRLLLDRGADVKAKNAEGITALHLAAMENRPNVVGMLLKRGADPKARTTMYYNRICKGTTPLHLAVGNCGMVELLIKHGAEMEARNDDGNTVFYCAGSWRKTETVRRLAELGAHINTTNNNGDTVLHENSGSTEMTATLLEIGVKVDTRNSAGETALHLAAHGYNGVLKLLLDYGADVNALDDRGMTALHRASSWSNGHEASMQVLVERGADRKIRDRNGKTAVDLFRRSRRDQTTLESIISRLDAI